MSNVLNNHHPNFQYLMLVYSDLKFEELQSYYEEIMFSSEFLITEMEDQKEEEIVPARVNDMQIEFEKRLSEIKKLYFYFFSNSNMRDISQSLSNGANLFLQLEELSMKFSWQQKINEEDFNHFGQFIQNLPSLTILNLSLGNPRDLFTYTLGDVLKLIINPLNNLRSLKLKIFSLKITPSCLQRFSEVFQNLPLLQSLNLRFSEMLNLQTSDAVMIGEALSKCVNLKYLKFVIGKDNQLLEQGMIVLVNAIQNLSKLETLALDIFGNENVCKEPIKSLKRCFQSLKNLKILRLKVGGNQFSEEGISLLGDSIQDLEKLEELEMLIENSFNFGSQFKFLLDSGIFQGMNSLKNLSFVVGRQMKQCELSRIFENIKYLSNLSNLKFQIKHMFIHSNFNFDHFINCTEQLQQLRVLNLDIISNVSNESFTKISEALLFVINLEYLSLNLRSYLIMDDHLKDLFTSLKQLQKLKYLKASIIMHNDIFYLNNKTVLQLLETIQTSFSNSVFSMQTLNSIYLSINNQQNKLTMNRIKRRIKRLVVMNQINSY